MFARTERLLLRPAWAEDAPALFTAIADEGIVRNLASAPWPYLPEHAEAFVMRERDPRRPASLIFQRTDGAPQLVGAIGIHDTPEGDVELGYWIARPYWNRGFATEAGRAVIGFACNSLRLRRLVAGHFIDNPASGRVLRKLGFRPAGAVRSRFSAGRGGEAECAELELEFAAKVPAMPLPACMMAA
ncbi:MAG: GNAT family N-acetyltransferase [Allosphingosinicella sp.]|uniref:GNAT family N-acetyltransferase n=1 Tax=Allosphingosinicella sp. TaxID=2823234 RepID=UPI00393571CC